MLTSYTRILAIKIMLLMNFVKKIRAQLDQKV